jgi:hypothetical protein
MGNIFHDNREKQSNVPEIILSSLPGHWLMRVNNIKRMYMRIAIIFLDNVHQCGNLLQVTEEQVGEKDGLSLQIESVMVG